MYIDKPGEIRIEDEGLWSMVTHSGGNKNNLVYGQVKLASPTRYEVLRDIDEDGTSVTEPAPDLEKTQDVAEVELPKPQRKNVDREGVCVLPSRHSKSAHKILSDQSHKAKNKIQSNFSKKQTKNKH